MRQIFIEDQFIDETVVKTIENIDSISELIFEINDYCFQNYGIKEEAGIYRISIKN